MKVNNFVMATLLVAVSACSSNKRETPKGYEYEMIKEGTGEAVKVGEYLVVNMLFKDGNDSIWSDTNGNEVPMLMAIQEAAPSDEGLEEIFRTLKAGDSIVCAMPAKTLFEKTWRQPVPPTVDSTSNFTFNIGVKEILTEEQMRTLEQELMAKFSARQTAKDAEIINAHLTSANIEAQSTPSGLRYQITKQGNGANATPGQEVSINYAGYLLDGTLFDTSIESIAKKNNAYNPNRPYEPYTFTAGTGAVIRGWDEAILLMNKGTKMRVWIPSPLAYGPQQRSEVITENSILVFEMEMVDLK